MDTTVLVCTHRVAGSAIVGYFATAADVPEGWTLATESPLLDIEDVMTANRCSREQALRLMNAHWQR